MQFIESISKFMEDTLGINQEYFSLFTLSVISFLIIKLISKCLKKIFELSKGKKSFILYQRSNLILNIINVIIIFIIWDSYLDNIITIISFISAALTLALREFIFNFFSGIYIQIKKPFKIDDRISFNNTKGDVINIGLFDFEMLEVGDVINGEQSTGKVLIIPNSIALTTPLKNYGKDFKYIWNEIVVKTTLDVNPDEVKKMLYEIINANEVVKAIPMKMRNSIEHLSLDQRIYYNKVQPIIYMRVVDSHIEFYVRYLIHPKKNRTVEDEVWSKILTLYREDKIKLYVE